MEHDKDTVEYIRHIMKQNPVDALIKLLEEKYNLEEIIKQKDTEIARLKDIISNNN